MKAVQTKREQEKRMVTEMILLYCKKRHKTKEGDLCAACKELTAYAQQRSDTCPFMESKTFCSNCKIHCYNPDMRKQIRAVMCFSGPRMLWYHPVWAIRHVMATKLEKKKLEEQV